MQVRNFHHFSGVENTCGEGMKKYGYFGGDEM